MADKIGEYMVAHGTKMIRPCVPTKVFYGLPWHLDHVFILEHLKAALCAVI